MTWGFFKLPDTHWRVDGLVELTEPLVYTTRESNVTYVVPAGLVSDLESRPLVLPGVINLFLGSQRETAPAALLHDWLYQTKPVTRAQADGLYFEALDWLRLNNPQIGTVRNVLHRIGETLAWTGLRIGGWAAWNADSAK